MINGYDDFDVGDNVNDDVLIRRRPVQFSVTSSSAGQLKSPQTFFVCRSVAPSHFRSSSSLNAFIFLMYLYCHVSMCRVLFLTVPHTFYLSQTPQTCLCKNFLSGVNFSRMSEKNAYI